MRFWYNNFDAAPKPVFVYGDIKIDTSPASISDRKSVITSE